MHIQGPYRIMVSRDIIARLPDGKGNALVAQVKHQYVGPFKGQDLDTARLLAMAPELLDELRNTTEELERLQYLLSPSHDGKIGEPDRDTIRRAKHLLGRYDEGELSQPK